MKTFVAISLMLLSLFSYAGPLPPNDLSGETLRTWLQDNWHKGKHNDLGYNEARRAMYSFVDVGTDGRLLVSIQALNKQAKTRHSLIQLMQNIPYRNRGLTENHR